jgi:hypothetical protein
MRPDCVSPSLSGFIAYPFAVNARPSRSYLKAVPRQHWIRTSTYRLSLPGYHKWAAIFASDLCCGAPVVSVQQFLERQTSGRFLGSGLPLDYRTALAAPANRRCRRNSVH